MSSIEIKPTEGPRQLARLRPLEARVPRFSPAVAVAGVRVRRAPAAAAVLLCALAALLAAAAFVVAPAQAAPRTVAEPGEGAGRVSFPIGVAVDQGAGDLYVVDRNNFRIDKFDSEGNFLLAWGWGVADGTSQELQTCGPASSPLRERCFGPNLSSSNGAGNVLPAAVAVDQSSHDVYVADSTKRRITKFTETGEFVFMLGKGVNTSPGTLHPNLCLAAEASFCTTGVSGTGPNEFATPRSLAVTSTGTVWVGDNERLKSFDASGTAGPEIVLSGAGNTQSLALDSAGDFYVRSASLAGIRKLAGPGAPVPGELLETLDAAGQPRTVTLDAAGDVYVGDATSPYRFEVYDSSGEQVGQFGAGQVLGTPGSTSSGANAIAVGESASALYAASSESAANSFVQRFTLPTPGPLIEGQHVEDLLPTTATLATGLNPEGRETSYRFEYDTIPYGEGEAGHGTSVPIPDATLAASFEEQQVQAELEELSPDTTYHFRLVAESECEPVADPGHICVSEGPDTSFTTRSAVAIDAQWASDVAARSVALHGELDPLGVAAEWWIEYGSSPCDQGGCAQTARAILPAGFGDVAVGAVFGGLAPGTTYHYRFAAEDEREGATYAVHGADRSFTTQLAGLGFSLADDRAWEMVTPPDKQSATLLTPNVGTFGAAAAGSGLAYQSRNSIAAEPDGSRSPENAFALAGRSGAGKWSSTDIMAPNAGYEPNTVGFGYEYVLFSADLSRAVLDPRDTAPLSPAASERTPYLRRNTDPPTYTPLVTAKEGFANVPPGTEFGTYLPDKPFSGVRVVGGTADLSHILLKPCCTPLKPGDAAQSALYEWVEGRPPAAQLRRVSVLPHGETAVAGTPGFGIGSGSGSTRHMISADGSRVFWTAGGGFSGLYLRDTDREESVRLDVVQPGAFGTGAVAPRFQGANSAGTVAFFTDTQNLTPDANESGADLYRCEVKVVGGELECELSDLTAQTGGATEAADVQGLTAGVSDDGSRVYFVARGVLSGENAAHAAPVSRQPNLYVWRQGAGIVFVAALSEEDESDWGSNANTPGIEGWVQTAAASPSGRYLAFMSERSLTDYDNRDAASGQPAQEVFSYDADAGSLTCASCNPSSTRPVGRIGMAVGLPPLYDPHELWSGRTLAATLPEATLNASDLGHSYTFYRPRAVLDNGRLFFNAADSLVPADSNGNWDVYQYEPTGTGGCTVASGDAGTARLSGGCVSLISSGTADQEAAFLDASESGNDVFFYTPAQLSVTDEDHITDIYDARVDGIAATLTPRTECLGEACQPASSAPDIQTPASAGFQGPGNLTAQRDCRGPARKASRLRHRAERLRRGAKQALQAGNGHAVERRTGKARGLAKRARKLSAQAKRCRRGGATKRSESSSSVLRRAKTSHRRARTKHSRHAGRRAAR